MEINASSGRITNCVCMVVKQLGRNVNRTLQFWKEISIYILRYKRKGILFTFKLIHDIHRKTITVHFGCKSYGMKEDLEDHSLRKVGETQGTFN